MNGTNANPSYSFETIHQIIFRGSDRFIGPLKPIDDPKLVAGLLFVPHNSWSTRTICSSPHYCNGGYQVSITFFYDMAEPTYRRIPITNKAKQWLQDEHYVEGTPQMGYTDMSKLHLNKRGNQAVVTDWFNAEAGIMEYLAAGATIHGDGRITW